MVRTVTKGKMSILALLFSCLKVDSRPVNFISDRIFSIRLRAWVTSSQQACFKI